jgi:alanine-alpha-ketoisovalerate/valine-pyruvate aminotransferase
MNVRKEFNSITVLEDLETFIQNVSTKAKQLGNEIRKLTMENANLLKINQTVIKDFQKKMAALS